MHGGSHPLRMLIWPRICLLIQGKQDGCAANSIIGLLHILGGRKSTAGLREAHQKVPGDVTGEMSYWYSLHFPGMMSAKMLSPL